MRHSKRGGNTERDFILLINLPHGAKKRIMREGGVEFYVCELVSLGSTEIFWLVSLQHLLFRTDEEFIAVSLKS